MNRYLLQNLGSRFANNPIDLSYVCSNNGRRRTVDALSCLHYTDPAPVGTLGYLGFLPMSFLLWGYENGDFVAADAESKEARESLRKRRATTDAMIIEFHRIPGLLWDCRAGPGTLDGSALVQIDTPLKFMGVAYES